MNVALDHCPPKNDNDAEDFDLSVLVATLDKWVILESCFAAVALPVSSVSNFECVVFDEWQLLYRFQAYPTWCVLGSAAEYCWVTWVGAFKGGGG